MNKQKPKRGAGMGNPKTIKIDEVEYVRADSVASDRAPDLSGMPYCMVRTYSAGVFAGYVERKDGKVYTLRNARRIWKWEGAASLSQLATDGTSKPGNCKFPCAVDEVTLTEVIEVIPITARAAVSIDSVQVWSE